jgi:hypothetical protein
VRQFLDIGTGIPAAGSTHEVAQAVAPESRVVYVDCDPVVLAHARALLTSHEAVAPGARIPQPRAGDAVLRWHGPGGTRSCAGRGMAPGARGRHHGQVIAVVRSGPQTMMPAAGPQPAHMPNGGYAREAVVSDRDAARDGCEGVSDLGRRPRVPVASQRRQLSERGHRVQEGHGRQ